MVVKYLLDENLPPLYREQLFEWQPDLVVMAIGDNNVPPKGTKDKRPGNIVAGLRIKVLSWYL